MGKTQYKNRIVLYMIIMSMTLGTVVGVLVH